MSGQMLHYDANMNAYGDAAAEAAAAAAAKTEAAKGASMWGALFTGLGSFAGSAASAGIISASNKSMNNATLDSNERQFMAKLEADKQSMLAMAGFQSGGSGKAIALVFGGVVVMGGAAYFLLRKKK